MSQITAFTWEGVNFHTFFSSSSFPFFLLFLFSLWCVGGRRDFLTLKFVKISTSGKSIKFLAWFNYCIKDDVRRRCDSKWSLKCKVSFTGWELNFLILQPIDIFLRRKRRGLDGKKDQRAQTFDRVGALRADGPRPPPPPALPPPPLLQGARRIIWAHNQRAILRVRFSCL